MEIYDVVHYVQLTKRTQCRLTRRVIVMNAFSSILLWSLSRNPAQQIVLNVKLDDTTFKTAVGATFIRISVAM